MKDGGGGTPNACSWEKVTEAAQNGAGTGGEEGQRLSRRRGNLVSNPHGFNFQLPRCLPQAPLSVSWGAGLLLWFRASGMEVMTYPLFGNDD